MYAPGGNVALVAEIKAARTTAPRRTQLREQLLITAKAFEAPFALLKGDEGRTWFAIESNGELREMPDDSELIARFGPSDDAR